MLRGALQVVFLVGVVLLLRWLFGNLIGNLDRAGLSTDLSFLDQPAGFQILGSDFRASQTVREALLVGLANTISVAAIGIVLATILGVAVGVASLSTNWLVRKAATLYVETLRNLPPLIVIVFTFSAVILRLPRIQEAADWFGLVIVSNRTIGIVAPAFEGPRAGTYQVVLLVALVGAAAVWIWRTRRNVATGEPHHRVALSAAVVLVVGGVGWFALGGPLVLDRPQIVGVQVEDGWAMSANYAALLLALVVYTASYIAEIVRGSIQAVPKGQVEASDALALSGFQRLRFVVLPQAFRIAVPPMANQYLNLTKNSSLALAIGFFELTQTTLTVIGNGNPAPQSIGLMMLTYLALSLTIAAVTNLVNRRLHLVSR
ncbi:amino acid ABC transporter permease [Actinomarinicola tropica]|uniref:amino acid ABC transporter permease n=1 Tax=Actinomarinicola tropica TaxID=2789776 RepID=UPI0018998CBB|nr:ABC transporter permease subunit [Actinomarinicola tropica]